MSVNAHLAYVDALRRLNARAVTFLKPGNANAGQGVRAAYPTLALPADVEAVWRAFNGIGPTGETPLGDIWLDGMFYLLSEAEAIDDYREALALQGEQGFSDYWPLGFFPVATPGDGSRLLVNCIAGSPTHGAVYELTHGVGVCRVATSLARQFEITLVCLERGAIQVTPGGQVEPDFARVSEIARELDPGCDGTDDTLPPAYESKDWL